MARHFCYEDDDCSLCTPRPAVVDLTWVTMETIGPDWAPPWWLAVPVAGLRRLLRW